MNLTCLQVIYFTVVELTEKSNSLSTKLLVQIFGFQKKPVNKVHMFPESKIEQIIGPEKKLVVYL